MKGLKNRSIYGFGVTHSGKRLSMRHDVDKSFFRGSPADPRKGSRCIVAVKGEERWNTRNKNTKKSLCFLLFLSYILTDKRAMGAKKRLGRGIDRFWILKDSKAACLLFCPIPLCRVIKNELSICIMLNLSYVSPLMRDTF